MIKEILEQLAPLDAQIADSFPARQQFATAAGFALRVTCPLAGREVPDLPQALGPRLAVARAMLSAVSSRSSSMPK